MSQEIEKKFLELGSYIDAVVDFAEERGFGEFEEIIPLLDPIVVDKIKNEFIEKNYLPSLKRKNSMKEFM
jgi:hypothetical protein